MGGNGTIDGINITTKKPISNDRPNFWSTVIFGHFLSRYISETAAIWVLQAQWVGLFMLWEIVVTLSKEAGYEGHNKFLSFMYP